MVEQERHSAVSVDKQSRVFEPCRRRGCYGRRHARCLRAAIRKWRWPYSFGSLTWRRMCHVASIPRHVQRMVFVAEPQQSSATEKTFAFTRPVSVLGTLAPGHESRRANPYMHSVDSTARTFSSAVRPARYRVSRARLTDTSRSLSPDGGSGIDAIPLAIRDLRTSAVSDMEGPPVVLSWSGSVLLLSLRPGSNWQPSPYKGTALPIELHRRSQEGPSVPITPQPRMDCLAPLDRTSDFTLGEC